MMSFVAAGNTRDEVISIGDDDDADNDGDEDDDVDDEEAKQKRWSALMERCK